MIALLANVKNWFRFAIIALILFLLGFAWQKHNAAVKAINQRDNALAEMQTKTGQLETYQNERGQTVTKILQYEKYIGDLEFSKDSLEAEIYKTVKVSKTKKKLIREATVIYIKSESSGPLKVDTTILISEEFGRVFNDGFLNALIFSDSLFYEYDEKIVLIKAQRVVERKFIIWRWIGWKKKINRDLVEITSNNPNSKLNGRFIKLE